MLKRDELRTAVATIGVDANIGSAVPQNMRRFIYKIKAINLLVAGPNLLTIGKRENGAGVTATIDYVQFATQYETWVDPDELKEDSAPLYIVEGKGATGDSYLRAAASGGAASAYLTIWYVDAPA